MKKLSVLLLALIMVLSLTACGSGETAPVDPPAASPADVPPESEEVPVPAETAYEIKSQSARLYTNSIGTVWLQTIVEIENTGSTNLYLSSGAYDIEDESGSLLAAQTLVSSYPDVLAPGEVGMMYEETIPENIVEDTPITVLPRPSVEEARVELIRYDVTDVSLTDGSYGGLSILGRVCNNTEADAEGLVYVVALLYGTDGSPLGLCFTILTEELPAGEKIGFEISSLALPEDVTADSVGSYVIYAYPLQMQF